MIFFNLIKEKTLSILKINFLALLLFIVVTPLILILFDLCNGINMTGVFEEIQDIFIFILVFLISILIHELIHALCFYIFTKNTKSIKIGFILSHLTPYTHCNQSLSKIQYMITLLMPGVILGIIPLIISFLLPDFLLLIYGIIMLTASLGDFIICFFLFQVPPHKKILDHDSKVGFWILD